jgi:cytoskeletal protein CcmA (bactofilin family)
MLGFNRTPDPRSADARTGGKLPLKPALYDPPGSPARTTAGIGTRPSTPPAPTTAREGQPAPVAVPSDGAARASATGKDAAVAEVHPANAPGSRLHVGVNIKLKGVEISDCDVLVIEGHVEATVHSKAMQIDKPGTLKGTALIDVAEIHGDFSGELTARTRLVVHGTGRVSGSIRYGKLIVAEGGEISGDVKRLDAANPLPQALHAPVTDSRFVLGTSST